MNWKRVAELAVLIYENYDKDHGVLPDPHDGHEIVFDMKTYVQLENGCVSSCCAFGYAYLKWHDELPKCLQGNHIRYGINYNHRAALFDLSNSVYDTKILNDMFVQLFDTKHASDPERYVYRTARFLNDYGQTDIELHPFKVDEVVAQLKLFMK